MSAKFQTEIDEAGRITIEPVKEETQLIEKDELIIVSGKLTGDITDIV